MLQAFLLAQCQAEPINGLYTACHQLLQTQPVLSFPALFSPPFVSLTVVFMVLGAQSMDVVVPYGQDMVLSFKISYGEAL